MKSKPILGISSCVLGKEVRYNGAHKRDDWVVKDLGKWVQWHSVCPEMEMGLGVPRESMRLKRLQPKGMIRLVGNQTQKDFTSLAVKTAKEMVSKLPSTLNGYILKNRSPSCGFEKVKVYDHNNSPHSIGVGFFAKELVKRFPQLPIIEEGRLKNPHFREHFVTRVFAHSLIHCLPSKVSQIQKFHESYKFVIQAHHEVSLRKLGKIAANSSKENPSEVLKKYQKEFLYALEQPTTSKKRANVIQHIYGFIKDRVNPREKKSILEQIEQYRKGKLPYVALVTLVRHAIQSHGAPYIENQRFFFPYPEELNLYYET